MYIFIRKSKSIFGLLTFKNEGDILASEDFKLKIILPEIARAWEAENGNLVDDWLDTLFF